MRIFITILPTYLVRMIGACLKGSAGENQRENSGGKSVESAPASPMPSFQQVPAMYSPYAMPHCLPFSMYHQPYLMPAMYPTMGYATPMSSPIYPQQMGSNFPVPSPQVEPFAHCFNPEDDNPRKPLLNPEDV